MQTMMMATRVLEVTMLFADWWLYHSQRAKARTTTALQVKLCIALPWTQFSAF